EHLVVPEAWFERQSRYVTRSAEELTADARRQLAAGLRDECRFQQTQLASLSRAGLADVVAGMLSEYAAALDAWCERLTNSDALLDVSAEVGEYKFGRLGKVSEQDKARVDEVRKRWLDGRLKKRWAREVVEPIVEAAPAAAELARTLLGLERGYCERLESAKHQQSVFEFGDVLSRALRLLGTAAGDGTPVPTPIAFDLRRRYEHVLVDEYQDTSPVQVALLRLVTRDQPGTANRFMVGDVKQSIYGFREAEPRLFVEQADSFEHGREDGKVIYLADNFRSHASVVKGLNHLFARLFDMTLGGTAFGEQERLAAGRAEVNNPSLDQSPRIQVHVLEQSASREHSGSDDSEDGQSLLERIERESIVAVELVRDLLARGVSVPAREPDESIGLRPLRRSDIAVLLRSAQKNAGYVARVFRDYGLPCMAGGRESLLAALEVQDICNVLRLLTNQRQGIPLAAYLRGPLVEMNAGDLWKIRQMTPKGLFSTAVRRYRESGLERELVTRLDAAMEQLERWDVSARHLELPALLRRIIRDGDLDLFAAGLPDGPRRVASLDALVRYAAAFAAGGDHGVGDFVQHLEQLAEQDLDPGAAAAGEADVINIMTVHGAKGLEFPVVLLLNAGAKFNNATLRQTLQLDERDGLGLRFVDYPRRRELQSAAFHRMCYAAQARDVEEELRLLYVAATRAREQLYVIGHTVPDAWAKCQALYAADAPPLISRLTVRSTLEWVLMAAAGGDVPAELLSVTTRAAAEIGVTSEPATPSETRPLPWSSDDEDWLRRAESHLKAEVELGLSRAPAVMSVSRWKELATRDAAAEQPMTLDAHAAPLSVPTFAGFGGSVDGRTRGTAVHRFLQHVDLLRLSDAAAIRAQTAVLVADGRLDASDAALLPIDDLVWLGQSADGQLLAAHAEQCHREVPLVYAYPTGIGDERTIIRGVIDCLVETPDGLVLLDYKTDSPRDNAALTRRIAGYEVQLQLYAVAAAAIFERPVIRAALVFLTARISHNCQLERPSLGRLLSTASEADDS
ncbi:MAG: UvrD-helicase domain-containing protein, partial [Phycisphaerae bacterium]|nr:UvrD-helicase domain-containing protein [Phycisphaerae bacterium]